MENEATIYKEMRKSESLTELRFDRFLLSICTAAVLGMFGFLWTMNTRMAVMEERDRVNSENYARMQSDLNSLKLNVNELTLKVVQLQVVKDEHDKK